MLLEGLEVEVCKQVKSVGCRAQRNSKLNWEFMIKARNVKWGMGSPTSPGHVLTILSILDEYGNSPREAAPSGRDWADFEVQNRPTDE